MICAKFHISGMFPFRIILKILKKCDFSQNLTFDLWTLTFTSESLGKKSFYTRVPSHQVWRELAQSIESSSQKREYALDILSRDLWPWLPWQPYILVVPDTFNICVYFHVSGMFPFGIILKNVILQFFTQFDLWPRIFDLWSLTFSSEGQAHTTSNPRVPSHQIWRESVRPTRRSNRHSFFSLKNM